MIIKSQKVPGKFQALIIAIWEPVVEVTVQKQTLFIQPDANNAPSSVGSDTEDISPRNVDAKIPATNSFECSSMFLSEVRIEIRSGKDYIFRHTLITLFTGLKSSFTRS